MTPLASVRRGGRGDQDVPRAPVRRDYRRESRRRCSGVEHVVLLTRDPKHLDTLVGRDTVQHDVRDGDEASHSDADFGSGSTDCRKLSNALDRVDEGAYARRGGLDRSVEGIDVVLDVIQVLFRTVRERPAQANP